MAVAKKEQTTPSLQDVFGEVIHSYTRRQAIDDGVLIDVSEMAREAGIKFPVAVTAAVWSDYIKPPENITWQDEAGRLWDTLWMFRLAAGRSKGELLFFTVGYTNKKSKFQEIRLKALCGPGDDWEPVITIMKPDED